MILADWEIAYMFSKLELRYRIGVLHNVGLKINLCDYDSEEEIEFFISNGFKWAIQFGKSQDILFEINKLK